MSQEKIDAINKKMESIFKLKRAPSQKIIFLHLLGTGKTLTVSEISSEVGMSSKATERAVAKLLQKELIQRAPFRARSYNCDSKEIFLGLLLTVQNINEKLI
jgi:predicted transcriptional regulator